ncbi:MAG TPA: M56 family metallopeptidase [Bryobacteraceae bacterium]|nr:M56 family metallopeptidase [Bryobacteraceae bacterium]
MTGQALFDTLLVWSAQICLLAVAGALTIRFLHQPKARLWAWQGLLLLLLALPMIEPWRMPLPEALPALIEDAGVGLGLRQALGPQAHHWSRADLLWIIALGAALRLFWIGAGLLRLGRYRKDSRLLPTPPVPFGSSSARWYLHPDLTGPVTYGWPRASVLLPARFEEMEASMREAIACHELIHVVRRDWLFVMAEEAIRAAFWFHPAVWFVLSRVQLAREQVVDREVIRVTRDRDRYLDALVAVAEQKIQPDLAPAPLFLRKRQLAHRVAAVLQEVSMSRTRLFTTLATICSALLVAARISVWLIPFSVPAQVQPDDPGVAVDAGAALLHRTPVHIPANVTARGVVVVEVSLNAKGEVSDARVLSGPDELRKPVLESVLNWHYEAGPASAQVKVKVAGAAAATHPDGTSGPTYYLDPAYVNGQFPATLTAVNFRGITADAQEHLRGGLPFHEGDVMQYDDLRQVESAVTNFDSHLKMTIHIAGNHQFSLLFAPPGAQGDSAAVGFPPPAPGVQRVRVGGNMMQTKLVNRVMPKYPPEAKQQHITGKVSYNALIGAGGQIVDLHLISGEAILADAALQALKQWTYQPTLLNGKPVEVVTQIDVNFTLAN